MLRLTLAALLLAGACLLPGLAPGVAWGAEGAASSSPADVRPSINEAEPPLRPLPRRHHPKGPRPKEATLQPTTRWVFEDVSATRRAQQLSFMVGGAFDTVSAGIFYAVPLVVQGFLHEINNSVYLELGILANSDFSSNSFLTGAAGLRWNFYLTTRWATFAALRANFNVGLSRAQRLFFVLPDVSLGALYRLSRAARLRLELGFPTGIGVGVAVQF